MTAKTNEIMPVTLAVIAQLTRPGLVVGLQPGPDFNQVRILQEMSIKVVKGQKGL